MKAIDFAADAPHLPFSRNFLAALPNALLAQEFRANAGRRLSRRHAQQQQRNHSRDRGRVLRSATPWSSRCASAATPIIATASSRRPRRSNDANPNFDPLADLIAKGHNTAGGNQRIDVHAWIVNLPHLERCGRSPQPADAPLQSASRMAEPEERRRDLGRRQLYLRSGASRRAAAHLCRVHGHRESLQRGRHPLRRYPLPGTTARRVETSLGATIP